MKRTDSLSSLNQNTDENVCLKSRKASLSLSHKRKEAENGETFFKLVSQIKENNKKDEEVLQKEIKYNQLEITSTMKHLNEEIKTRKEKDIKH